MTNIGVASLVIEMRQVNPCATLKEIGDEVGVTRERVRQILKLVGLPTKHYIRAKGFCPSCNKPLFRTTKFCSKECRHNYLTALLICSECEKWFERSLARIKASTLHRGYKGSGVFCSKQCFGRWAGKNHGFAAHPENARFHLIRATK